MEKVSAKMFFTVLWKGVCQSFGWFFGLFGYKRDGKFSKCVWGLFATSAAVIMFIIAGVFVYGVWDVMERHFFSSHQCESGDCYHSQYVNGNIYFHNTVDGKGYVYNCDSKEVLIRQIDWIATPMWNDSLVCFSKKDKRGYFNKYTGEVVIEPKYRHAWIFSDGLASVEDEGRIKFIDGTGKVVIDNNMPYIKGREGYVFHGGYCVVSSKDGSKYGLIDKTGKAVIPIEYSDVRPSNDYELWCVEKDNQMAVLDKNLKTVLPMAEYSVYFVGEYINVVMPDHTEKMYDTQGNLINDFVVYEVRMLEYEKDEILYSSQTSYDDNRECNVQSLEAYRPHAIARLRAYRTSSGYEGLMSADGRVITLPLYKDIEAIGSDLYLCELTDCEKVVVDGKGKVVK